MPSGLTRGTTEVTKIEYGASREVKARDPGNEMGSLSEIRYKACEQRGQYLRVLRDLRF